MLDSADSNWLRVGAYLLAAGLSLLALLRERRRAADVDGVWPAFWLLTSCLLVAMAIGRAAEVGDLISDVGRDEVVSGGWYESRRPVQVAVVAVVGLGWAISVIVALWRTPERRRRYLPMALAVATLVAFAAVRIVSLHQVDTVLHRRHIAGVRVGTVTELCLVMIASAVSFWVPAGRPNQHGSSYTPAKSLLESS